MKSSSTEQECPRTQDGDSKYTQEQYRISPREEGYSIWDALLSGIDLEDSLKRSTVWMYRKGYAKVVIVLCLVYFCLVTIYGDAIGIVLVDGL